MCKGFGMIVTCDLNAYFTCPDTMGNIHHSDSLAAPGWDDVESLYTRRFCSCRM